MELYRLDPWGEVRADLRSAKQQQTFAAVMGAKPEAIRDLAQFVLQMPLDAAEEPPEPLSPEEMLARLGASMGLKRDG